MSKNYYSGNKLLSCLADSLNQKFVFYLIYFLFILITIAYLISYHIEYPYLNQHFSYLANSFLHGKLYFLDKPTIWSDTALFNGRYFWPLGQFPAVLLTPFVGLFSLFGLFFSQLYLQILFLFLIICIIYQLGRRLHYDKDDSLIWSFAFIFSSMFFGVAAIHSSWFFSQVITVLLLFLFIYEFHRYNTEHIFRLTLLVGLLIATRLTAGIGAFVFLLLTVSLSKKNYQQKVASFIRIILSPILIIVLGLLLYNYLRFGNILESGYSLQLLPGHLLSARNEGMFNISHIPNNLYYALISAPLPVLKDSNPLLLVFPYIKINYYGIGIFFTSLWLLNIFSFTFKDKLSIIILISVSVTALIIFSYYGVGYRQFGYRYALDFFPFIFYLFLLKHSNNRPLINAKLKTLIYLSAIINLYLLYT